MKNYFRNASNIYKNEIRILILILTGITSITTVLIPYLHQILINELTVDKSFEIIIKILIFLVFIYFVELLTGYMKDIQIARLTENIKRNLRIDLHDSIQKLPYTYFLKNKTENALSRYNEDIQNISSHFGSMLIDLLKYIITLLLVVAMMAANDIRILILSIFILFIYFLINKLIAKRLKNVSKEYLYQNEKLLGIFIENYSNSFLVKTYNLYEKMSSRFKYSYNKTYEKTMEV